MHVKCVIVISYKCLNKNKYSVLFYMSLSMLVLPVQQIYFNVDCSMAN